LHHLLEKIPQSLLTKLNPNILNPLKTQTRREVDSKAFDAVPGLMTRTWLKAKCI